MVISDRKCGGGTGTDAFAQSTVNTTHSIEDGLAKISYIWLAYLTCTDSPFSHESNNCHDSPDSNKSPDSHDGLKALIPLITMYCKIIDFVTFKTVYSSYFLKFYIF